MDFRYLTESKNDFFNFLCEILTPNIYHGLCEMLEYSINMYNMLEERKKRDKTINNPGVVNIFKMCLRDISTLNNLEIENEYKKIKQNSKCSEWFDELIRCTFKSHVLFLTYDPTIENSTYKDNEIYNSLSIKDFIHRCYVESSEYFLDNCDVFIKKSDRREKIYEIIKNCINNSIRKILPYNDILKEYMRINFTIEKKKEESTKLSDIKQMVYEMINKNKYGNKPSVNKLVQDSPSSSSYKGEPNDVEEFINLENRYEAPKVLEVQLSSNEGFGNKLITSTVEDRLEKKNQEIEMVMAGENNYEKKLENIYENSLENISQNTSENIQEESSSSENIQEESSSSENIQEKSSENINKENLSSDNTSEEVKLVNSPPAIRINKNEKLKELTKSDIKKNIEIIKNNSSTLSEQEKFFDILIK
jgi:hypothetical protein